MIGHKEERRSFSRPSVLPGACLAQTSQPHYPRLAGKSQTHEPGKKGITVEQLDIEKTCQILNRIMEYELAGVVRYTHYSLMVTGPYRMPIVDFMQAQASESLLHAQKAGEIITGLDRHPEQSIAPISETHDHEIYSILKESLEHELKALGLYKDLLGIVDNASVYLEEYARTMIGQEELHVMELRKMLRDFSG